MKYSSKSCHFPELLAVAAFAMTAGCANTSDAEQTSQNSELSELLTEVVVAPTAIKASCSNLTLALANATDTQAVWVQQYPLFSEESWEAGAVAEIDLQEHPDALRVEFGERLTIDACDDAIDAENLPEVARSFAPIGGTIHVEITDVELTPQGGGPLYHADVRLDAVVFEAELAPISVDLGVHVFGWSPG